MVGEQKCYWLIAVIISGRSNLLLSYLSNSVELKRRMEEVIKNGYRNSDFGYMYIYETCLCECVKCNKIQER